MQHCLGSVCVLKLCIFALQNGTVTANNDNSRSCLQFPRILRSGVAIRFFMQSLQTLQNEKVAVKSDTVEITNILEGVVQGLDRRQKQGSK